MTVYIYNNYSTDNTIYKNISLVTQTSAELKGTSSVSEPTLILSYNTTNFNYMYIPDFGRYYHAYPTVDTGGRVVVSGDCDVLMSAKNAVLNTTAYVVRNEFMENKNIADEKMIMNLKKSETVESFGQTIIDDDAQTTFILTLK